MVAYLMMLDILERIVTPIKGVGVEVVWRTRRQE